MTPTKLRNYTCKDLAQMAKCEGVSGWHSMRKEELIRALVRQASKKRRATQKKRAATQAKRSASETGHGFPARSYDGSSTGSQRKMRQLESRLESIKSLASEQDRSRGRAKDRWVVMVRDPYWLHAFWELSSRSVERARSALGQNWHRAQPVLRLFRVDGEGNAEFERQVVIHGGVNNWYIDVHEPPSKFRIEIGYAADADNFYCLARSNIVTTPPAGASETRDDNWADVAENADRIFAMSGGYSAQGTSLELQELMEERLNRPLGTPLETRYGDGAARILYQPDDLSFAIDAELVVYGASHPHAHVTVKGEPVQLRPDGTFAVRVSMPERRQVLPVVASSPDGSEQRTIILAVERNTKVMEPMHRDPGLVQGKK